MSSELAITLITPDNELVRQAYDWMQCLKRAAYGAALFRQTGAGVSLVADAYGRILNRVDGFAAENNDGFAATQQVETPIGSVDTVYPLVGDAFGWAMQIGLVGLLGLLWIKRRPQ